MAKKQDYLTQLIPQSEYRRSSDKQKDRQSLDKALAPVLGLTEPQKVTFIQKVTQEVDRMLMVLLPPDTVSKDV